MRPRLSPVLMASLGASALAGWVLVPWLWSAQPRLARPPGTRSAEWRMPDLPRKPDQAGLGLLMVTSPIFEPEAAASAAAAQPEDPRWRIAGIFGSGRERTVLIDFLAPGKPSLRLRVGSRLPSGDRITRIEANEVCVQLGRKSHCVGVDYLVP